MKNIIWYGFIIFTIVLTLTGFSKLKNSVDRGTDLANEYLRTSMGGSMDADDFRTITEGFILSNITLGGIMFLVGLTFFCVSIYRLINEKQ
ncbi:hypothetical protein [Aquibacillus albus]|uniref:DUF4321 domain-containing protein n=1 Tax=Aquibacillus albus TaxID=1168171 RepID=A0ABS2MY20_9BACI|nr:hypothetical protein [Aquibacillus albus]MBM7570784.1 hypothetical protein [Aquibacillus albus]